MGLFDSLFNKKITPESRREKNNEYIKSKGINCLDLLPVIESKENVKLKDIDTICKRAIACLISIQLSCDLRDDSVQDKAYSLTVCNSLLNKYDVANSLIDIEKRLYNNTYSEQDLIDMDWAYETYWAIIWALGLVNDILEPNSVCNCEKAIGVVLSCKDYNEFKSKCKLRDIDTILDMLDLYYRYHWACVELRVNNKGSIGSLEPGVVMERRKGLEWLISNEEDWNNISLDT